ncbi:MAG: hypothetical protein LRY28_02630 [Erysipelotrichaceae bacterium]|nr:hypothetical protein [Erysipelotrichaceae bacterium]
MKKISLILLVIFSVMLTSVTLYDAFLLEVSEKPIGDNVIDPNQPNEEDPQEPIEEPEPVIYDEISTDSMYQDQDMTITLEKIRKFESDVYVVRVQVRNMAVVQGVFAKDTFGKNISEATSKNG